MAQLIAEFFGLVGLAEASPETLGELIPYLFHFVVGVALVSGVFRAVGTIGGHFMDFRRY